MPHLDLATDRKVSFSYYLSRMVAGWHALDRGWQAVFLGLLVTAIVKVGIQIPW